MRGGCLLPVSCVGVDADRGWGLQCRLLRTILGGRQVPRDGVQPHRADLRHEDGCEGHVCLRTTLRASQATCTSARYASARMASTSRRARRTSRSASGISRRSASATCFDGHQQEIYSLDFSRDGRLIVSGSGDKTARIWDMLDGTSKVLTINDPDSLNNDAGVTSVAISPDGRWVAAGSLDTVVAHLGRGERGAGRAAARAQGQCV